MAAMSRRETDRKRAELGRLLNDPATPPDADRVRTLLAAPMALATPALDQVELTGAEVEQPPGGIRHRAAGHARHAELRHGVKLTACMTDMDRAKEARAVREAFCAAHAPASTRVEVSRLTHPDFLIGIEAIAVMDQTLCASTALGWNSSSGVSRRDERPCAWWWRRNHSKTWRLLARP
jgi:enamine deaminase RidA (YjgF/YER057c/UK114 family)